MRIRPGPIRRPTARTAPSPGIGASRPFAPASSGHPLPGPLRERMERSFGHDFSSVRVHASDRPAAAGADALARGEHLHFRPGAFSPDTQSGRELIGHELAHVVQQRAGGAAHAHAPGAAVHVSPSLEAEAGRAGTAAAAGLAAPVSGTVSGAPAQPGKKKGQTLARKKQQQIRDYKKTEGNRKVKVPSGEEDLAPPEELPKGFSTFHEYYASLRRGPRKDDDDNAGGGGGGGRGVMAH